MFYNYLIFNMVTLSLRILLKYCVSPYRNEHFLKACERYIMRLGEELSSQTINRRDNILMVQLENEYGSYGDDKIYLSALKNMIQKAGFDIPLLTCDRGGQIEAGHLEGVFPAINGVLGDDILRL